MLQNFSISQRLLTSFVVIALFSFGVGILGYLSISSIGKDNLPSIQALGSIEKDINATIAEESEFVIPKIVLDPDKRQMLFTKEQENLAHIDSAEHVYEKLPLSSEDSATWKEFKTVNRLWKNEHDTAIIFAHQLDAAINGGQTIGSPDFARLIDSITGQVLDSREEWFASIGVLDKIIAMNQRDAAALVKSSTQQMALFSVLALIFGLGLGIFISTSIVKPIKHTTEMLKDIAQGEGDLTKRLIPQGKDEIAELCNWFNTFVDKIQDVVKNISFSTKTLASATEELSATSVQLATSAEETSSQSTTVASASEQASVNIQQIGSATSKVSQAINSIAAAIEEMNSSLQGVSQNCQEELRIATEASSQADTARTNMEQLGGVAQQVEKIIDVISDIADQTNLLALNATIEAASAGEAGKGFAVVAGEVKELARQTAQATTDIGEQIRKMQVSTHTAIASIQGIVAVINKINATSQAIVTSVAEQTSTISDLSKSVASVGADTNQIAYSVTESGNGLKEIASNIAGVNQATRSTAAGTTQINASTESLAKLASQLDQIVHQFKT